MKDTVEKIKDVRARLEEAAERSFAMNAEEEHLGWVKTNFVDIQGASEILVRLHLLVSLTLTCCISHVLITTDGLTDKGSAFSCRTRSTPGSGPSRSWRPGSGSSRGTPWSGAWSASKKSKKKGRISWKAIW